MTGSTKTFQYVGQRFTQGKSSLALVTFCASAADIHSWAGVPHKTDRYHGGFQRALGPRYRKIKKFFDDGQASPTSIVVAFKEGLMNIQSLAYPSAWPPKSELAQSPDLSLLSFSIDNTIEGADLTVLRGEVAKIIKARLELSDDSEQADDADSEESDEGEVEVDETAQDKDEDTLDVGHSKLKAFYEFIIDDEKVDAFLKDTGDEGKKKGKGKAKAGTESTPEEKLRATLISLLRPAMIVDGQHRVWGAYESDHAADISFTVNAIVDAGWIEQVFQFVVLNKLAKPISPGFLTSILNTSLTNDEVGVIEDRLSTIGIKSTDRKIMKYLNHEPKSPFFQMVAEPGEVAGINNKGKLSDKGMIRIAKRWESLKHKQRIRELLMFGKAVGETKKTKLRVRWKNYAVWTEYFYAFWDVIRDLYKPDGIWEKKDGFNLLYIVTMDAMQDMFLESKAAGDAQFANLDDFKDQVRRYFESVPSTFFQNWKATGLQSGDGPEWIKNAIGMFRNEATLADVKDESPLFKKP